MAVDADLLRVVVDERFVRLSQEAGGYLAARPDRDAVGLEEVLHRAALRHELRVRREVHPFHEHRLKLVEDPRVDGALDRDDAILTRAAPGIQYLPDGFSDVRALVRPALSGRRADGDERDAGRRDSLGVGRRESQVAFVQSLPDELLKARLVERHDAPLELRDAPLIDVGAHDFVTLGRERGAGGEPDVTCPDDGESHAAGGRVCSFIRCAECKGGQLSRVPALKCSTAGNAGALNFRVRNGIGCGRAAMTVQEGGVTGGF